MPVIILFLLLPAVALFTALAFYSQRPVLKRLAWFVLLFFTAWTTYSFRGVGLVTPFLMFAMLFKLLHSAQPAQSRRQLLRGCLRCLKI